MGKFTSKTGYLAFACLILPSLAWAAGMGKLTVLSALGQPLKAEIEVIALQAGEGDRLSVKLASIEAYRQANIELNPTLFSVDFGVERRAGGQYVVMLTSAKPVNEPFIDMLVELSWSNGRLVREFTFLLDPPEYVAPTRVARGKAAPAQAERAEPAPAAAAPAVPVPAAPVEEAAAPAAPAQESLAQPVPAEAVPAQPVEPPLAQPLSAEATKPEETPVPVVLVSEPPLASARESADTYEVQRGDTLSKIALQNRMDGVSLQQMLIALLHENQDAFIGDNVNRLRAGKILSIPDREAASSVDVGDARRSITAQNTQYAEYRSRIGAAVAATPARAEGGRQASGQIGAPKEETPAPPREAAKDQLRLSRADDAARGAKGAGAAAADDLAAKDKALKEANERIALLEKNIQDMQKLAQIRSTTGAQLQQQAQAAKSAQPDSAAKSAQADAAVKAAPSAKAAEPAAKAAPVAKSEAPKAAESAKADAGKAAAEPGKAPEAPKSAEAAKAPAAAKAPEEAKAPEPARTTPEPAIAGAPKAAPKAASKAAPVPPPAEPSLLDDLLEDRMALGGAGGVLILLAGYAAYAWRRKRDSNFGNSISGSLPSDTVSGLGSDGGRSIDTGSSSFQSDFSQSGIGKADAEEIDPIAEADVYVAYGRDAQAEEILKEALAKDSSRHVIRLKLLEIYANRKDARIFEAAANELRAKTGGQGPEWEKAVSLGLSIDPTNPLYGGKAEETPHAFDRLQRLAPVAPAALNMEPPPAPAPAEGPLVVDFDLGAGPVLADSQPDIRLDATARPQADPAPGWIDFDLGLGGDKQAAVAPATELKLNTDFNLPDSGTIDFDLGLPSGGDAGADASKAPDLMSTISLDLGMPGGGNGSGGAPDARWQEVATKLDLAKAYEEMGDKDGARELLKEVLKEGDAAQQQKAQTILQALG